MLDIKVGISYKSNIDKAIKIVDTILKKDKRVLKDPVHQIFIGDLADSSIILIIRPWVKVEDYLALKSDLLMSIKKEFDKNDIEIPFPQRDVHIKHK
jgi:small conductance mechanosensitive channel